MTGFFYYTGGILWMGAIFFVFPILYVSLLSTPKEGLIITLMAITFFSLIVFSEYSGYLPHKEIIKFNPYLYKDIRYIIGTVLMISLVFIFIFLAGKDFTQMLKQNNGELVKAKKKLEELSNKLEGKVNLQTDELKKSKDRLSILYQISRSISSTLELNNILKVILDFSVKTSNAGRGSIMLLDKKK
jgi:hypothetical protein